VSAELGTGTSDPGARTPPSTPPSTPDAPSSSESVDGAEPAATNSPGSSDVAGEAPLPTEMNPGAVPGSESSGELGEFPLLEASLSELGRALETRRLTPAQLTRRYLARIDAYDDAGPALNAVLARNPQALADAEALADTCRDVASRGPLCGIPVLLKDNIDAAGLPTTAGSLALARSVPARDAFLTQKLRAAGAIILGKATLTEFANFLGTGMPTGYSSLGGYGFNPYDPRPLPGGDGRPALQTGGSSSGSSIAVSANLVAVAVGTETSGSILSPASANGIVGIKPTLGLVSRRGILPLCADQDTAGPLARSVTDAAVLLGVLAGFDPEDPATLPCQSAGNCFADYTQFLDPEALQGARIAVPPFAGNRQGVVQAVASVLQAQGATLNVIAQLPGPRGTCTALPAPANCSSVLLYGFKRDLNAYLSGIADAPVGSLAELIAFNAATPGALKYGQALALGAQALDLGPGSADTTRYQTDRATDLQSSRAALDGVYDGPDGIAGTEDDVDALLFLNNSGAALPAMAGYPSITVPAGLVPPEPPSESPFPVGISFSGRRFSEPRLIALAYAFERASRLRQPPPSTPELAP
jgi:amidase